MKKGLSSKSKIVIFLLLCVACSVLLTGCIPGDSRYTQSRPAGFLSGVWHGWIAPLSLILGLINPKYRVYESINTGWFYDFGFYIAVISGFGGISLVRKKKKEDK